MILSICKVPRALLSTVTGIQNIKNTFIIIICMLEK